MSCIWESQKWVVVPLIGWKGFFPKTIRVEQARIRKNRNLAGAHGIELTRYGGKVKEVEVGCRGRLLVLLAENIHCLSIDQDIVIIVF